MAFSHEYAFAECMLNIYRKVSACRLGLGMYNGFITMEGLPCREIVEPDSSVTCVVCHMFVGWSIGLLTPAIHKTGHCCFHKHPELCQANLLGDHPLSAHPFI